MSRRKKFLVALAVLLLLVLAGGLTLDALVKSALESSLSRAFGTETTVESLDLEVFAGRVTVEGLRVASPEEFGDVPMLSLQRATLGAGLANVLRDTVDVREVRLEGLELTLLQEGTRSNFGPVLASAEKTRADGDEVAYRIREIVIRDVTARARLAAGPLGGAEAAAKVPEIRVENVGSGRGGAVPLSRLAGLTLQAVLQAVVRESGGLPASVRAFLRTRIGAPPGGIELRLPDATENGESLREKAGEKLKELLPGRGSRG